MDLDRQSIERRDFPIARRGYDPAAVDAHLRALAGEVQDLAELQREGPASGRASESLGSAAASQVQSILEAAESTAADIERQAAEDAARTREDAARDAAQTRTEAVQRAQAHVHAVAQATAVLLARVESMDGEVGALVQSLQAGAGRLAVDLGSVEAEIGALYDAAAGRAVAAAGGDIGAAPATPELPLPEPRSPQPSAPAPAAMQPPVRQPPVGPALTSEPVPVAKPVPGSEPAPNFEQAPIAPPTPAAPARRASTASPAPVARGDMGGQAGGGNGDIDGARLVALNMALNGESRERADVYLAENFQLADRAKLLDEVYAAIEV